jgi:prepilin-type N-terminal cleavage/methylation domain-containing protein
MKALRKNKGMTLIELLTVMGIIAVLAGVSLPAFHIIGRGAKLRNGAKTITDTLSSARGLAIAQRHSYYVEYDNETVINPEKNRLRIFYMPLDSSGKRKLPSNYNDRITYGEWKKLPDTIAFYDGNPITVGTITYAQPDQYVQFDPNGGVHGASSTTFTIVDSTTLNMNDKPYDAARMSKAKTCRIYVLNVTGRIKAVFE